MSIFEEIKKLIPPEMIGDSDVAEIADMVDLDIAYKLFLVEYPVSQEDIELFSNIPPVVKAEKRPDGNYQFGWKTEENGNDFRITTPEQTKIMRARFLLLRDYYSTNFDSLTLPKQNEVANKYDITYIPPKG